MIRSTPSVHPHFGAFRPLNRLSASVARTAAATLLCASAAMAGHTVVGFEGPNVGGWSFGSPALIEPSGGNPDEYLHAVTDTIAPQLRTTVITPEFHGNWRANKVASIGVDLITHSTQFPASRPLSVVLSSGDCQIHFVGTSLVPQPGTGWKSFTFPVPSQSLTMPAGWALLGGPCADPDGAWNTVMLNVTEIRFFYGDPTNFFIFDIWDVGADNVRIYPDAFTTLTAGGLAGTNGVPQLLGAGTLEPGSPVRVNLASGLPNGLATLIIGFSAVHQPFKGGVLIPSPDVVLGGLPMNGTGSLVVSSSFPPGIPGGLSFFFQVWFVDHGGAEGFAASNGVEAITP
jgi:hypothetical protein